MLKWLFVRSPKYGGIEEERLEGKKLIIRTYKIQKLISGLSYPMAPNPRSPLLSELAIFRSGIISVSGAFFLKGDIGFYFLGLVC